VGWHLDADITFDESQGDVHGVPTDVLEVKDLNVHLHAGIGRVQGWHRSLSLPSFTLQGVFTTGGSVQLSEAITITKIGVRLHGFHIINQQPDGFTTSGKDYGFSFFGDLHFKACGSSVPLEVSFDISELSSSLLFSSEVKGAWNNALGIKGLMVGYLPLGRVRYITDLVLQSLMGSRFLRSLILEPRCRLYHSISKHSSQLAKRSSLFPDHSLLTEILLW
jgi:hypothetical protein